MAASAIVLPAVPVTPPSYHRIVSPTLSIPTDHTLPIPVGLLACQRDPLLRELSTTVVSYNVHQTSAAPANNRKKKGSAVPAPGDPLLEVILHDTVLFPEGGGQSSDVGVLRAADGEAWNVVEVKRRGGHAIHLVQAKNGHAKGLEVGTRVFVSLGEEGFKRRLDHMSMHTSQHVLSALLETRLNLPTLSWALTTYPTPSYVELPRALTRDEIASIQEEANRLAFEGRKVHVEVEELDREREPGAVVHESGRTVGKALPGDYTGGVKRTVVIDGVDRNPCCGTHLPSLNNLQLMILPQTESVSRSSVSTSRLFFVCGPRLIAHATTAHNILVSVSNVLSCGPPIAPERVSQVVDERKRAEKRVEELESELAKFIAKELINEVVNEDKEEAAQPVAFRRHHHRTDDSSNALGFLQAITFSFNALLSTSSSASRKFLLVLSSSVSSQLSTSTTVILVMGSDEMLVKKAGEGVKSQLGVKGGGKGLKWSGKWTGVWKDSREGKLVQAVLDDIERV